MDGSVYDVFISFRGIDTRSGFTGNLHRALCGKQIKSFMDDHDLEKGAEINPTLDKAIQTSRIALVILSKNYASSTFCLDELKKIMDCSQHKGMLVLPVFYKVEPCDLRYQKGEYADALNKHEARIIDEKEKIEKWRFALTKISYLSGWNLKHYRYEYELIDTIVEHIIKRIHRLLDGEKEIRICNVDEKHVAKHNNVENLVTDPTPQKSLIEEINDRSISGILNYDSRKMIAAAVLIQRRFCRWRLHRELQAIKIQAAFRGYQVWKQYRKMIWSVGVVEKAILHWRLTIRGSRGLKHGNETEEDLFLVGRKQAEKRAERYVPCVKAVSSSKKSEEEYRRMNLAQPLDLSVLGVPNSADSGMVPQAGSPRSSLRPGQVPRGASAALCFNAGLNDLELNNFSDALSCFDESFRSLATEQSLGNDIKAQATKCAQYKIAVTLLQKIGKLQRVHHDPSAKDEMARLSRHLGSLPLQPKHRMISIRTAIKRNMEVQNYAYSKHMLELLLSKTAQSKQGEFRSLIELCIQRGLNNKSIDPLEDPSQFCAATLSRLSTIGYDVCDLCGSKFSAVNATGCIICRMGSIKR